MNEFHYIGFDIHKKTIQYCVKRADGTILSEGRIAATRSGLSQWLSRQHQPWKGAMEATMFTAWIYDYLQPYAAELKVAHSAMLKAIAASKHASDRLDARAIADLVRMDWIPKVWMAPPEIRSLRLLLRYRNLVVRQSTQTKNRIAATLMEQGVEYVKEKLHGKRYFTDLFSRLDQIPDPVRSLLQTSRGNLEMFQSVQLTLVQRLTSSPQLAHRVQLLATIPGVGQITALTWALEIGDPHRFPSAAQAMSYCGLVAALQESAGKQFRQPLSKKRNKHLQSTLIEAALMAIRYHPPLQNLFLQVKANRHFGAATVAVARKLVSYLLAVDKSGQPFQAHPSLVNPENTPMPVP